MFKKILLSLFLIAQLLSAQIRDIVVAEGDTIRIQPIGDSITRGTKGVTYRQYLKELLQKINVPVDFVGQCTHAADAGSSWTNYQELFNILQGDIQHDGWGGVRIDQLTDMTNNTRGYPRITIEKMVKDNPSDIILLMIGTNDIISSYQLSTAPVRLDTLISRILRSTEKHLIVTSIPPTPLPIANGKIQALNGAIPAIVDSHKAKGRKISFIDINAMMGNGDISDDSYHPNASGYEKIAMGFYTAITGIITDIKEKKSEELPKNYKLMQNFPNPFNPTTIINYSVPKFGKVQLEVFDQLGRKLKTLVNKEQDGGSYQVEFNAFHLSSGVYYYRLAAENFTDVKKMIILK